jgi:hypothetical protein
MITTRSLFSRCLGHIEKGQKVGDVLAKPVKRRRLADAYTFSGFRPLQRVQGLFGDPGARLVTLRSAGKQISAAPAGGVARVKREPQALFVENALHTKPPEWEELWWS